MFPLHDPLTDALREELSAYDDQTAALLSRRGIVTKEAAEKFLNPSYDLHLHDPLLMTDMPLAAKRLGAAILSGEKIAVWSDYDCDGIPGAVVLHDFLKKVEHLAPFGMDNPKPVFLFREVSVREISHFGKAEEHLKLKIDTNEGRGNIDAVTFFVKGNVARSAEKLSRGCRANLLAHLERDTFGRNNPVRLRLLDIRVI